MGSADFRTESGRLQHIKEQPEHLQFNKYIITGYRRTAGVKDCFQSLFMWHNQSLDIYTHLIPLLVILWSIYQDTFFRWNEIKHMSLAFSHMVACIVPFVGSTLYHLFMSYHGGSDFYWKLLRFDMFGVWITQIFGSLSGMYTTMFCASTCVKAGALFLYACVSLAALALAVTGRSIRSRMVAFSAQFAARMTFLGVRCAAGLGNPASVRHVFAMDAVALTGGLINAARWPERWAERAPLVSQRRHLADHVATSHQLMHVLVTWGIWHMHQAAQMDLAWMADPARCGGAALVAL